MKIVWVDINDLLPAAYNPRTHSDEDEQHLTESITKFGAVEPILVNGAKNRFNIVISGHFRLKIYRKLGYKKAPVVYADIPDIEREKELNLRMNRNTGDWNWDLLKEYDVGFLGDIGFDDTDLVRIFDNALETEDDHFDVEKELAAIKKPKSKIGDLYQLGSHRLIVGDSTDPAVIQRLMNGEKVSLIDTDPPFSIGLDYNKGISGTKHYGGKTNDNMSEEQYTDFLRKLIVNAKTAAKPDAHFFFWCDQNWIWRTQTLYRELGIKQQRVCWWLKGNWSMTPNVAFNKAGEAIVYGTTGKPYLAPAAVNLHEMMDKEIGSGNKMIEDIIDLFTIWIAKRLHGSEYEHPTQKNPTVHEKALRRCSKPGDIVLDLTAGSGSILTACEQMKRHAYMAEIEPVFADLIIRRFEALTGLDASLIKP